MNPHTCFSDNFHTGETSIKRNFFFPSATAPCAPWSPHYRGFAITFRHTTLGRPPLDE